MAASSGLRELRQPGCLTEIRSPAHLLPALRGGGPGCLSQAAVVQGITAQEEVRRRIWMPGQGEDQLGHPGGITDFMADDAVHQVKEGAKSRLVIWKEFRGRTRGGLRPWVPGRRDKLIS